MRIFRLCPYILLFLCFSCGESEHNSFDFSATKKKLIPLHQEIDEPQAGDWLLYHREKNIGFEGYSRSNPVRPTFKRNKIYVLPFGNFDSNEQKLVIYTAEYLQAFYGLETKVLPAVSDSGVPATYRRASCYVSYDVVNGKLIERPDSLKEQLQTTYILDSLLRPALPEDAAVMIALCNKDLFPDEKFNFVFGQARLKYRVGVWSFFRFGDIHHDSEFPLLLKRTLKTASHETGHMFSITHCSAYKCIMNGSNHLEEADRKPTFFCPNCLEKFCWNLGQTPQKHFSRLIKFWEHVGDTTEADRYRAFVDAL